MKRTRTLVMFVLVALALCVSVAYFAYRNGSGETVPPSPNDVQSERRIPDVSPPSYDVQSERRIPDGMRAVAIRVDADDLIGDVVPDSYVDVIRTRASQSTILLESVKVLAVSKKQTYRNSIGAVVTLVVTVKEAQRLTAVREGTRFALARLAGRPVSKWL